MDMFTSYGHIIKTLKNTDFYDFSLIVSLKILIITDHLRIKHISIRCIWECRYIFR